MFIKAFQADDPACPDARLPYVNTQIYNKPEVMLSVHVILINFYNALTS